MSPLYGFLRGLALGLITALARRRVEWRGRLPSGACIVVANHLSLIDPPLVAVSLPREVKFLAKRELFSNPLAGAITRLSGCIPLRREGLDRQALAQAEAHLRAGGVLGIFPEGQRSRSGELQRGNAGVGYLALRTGAPLVPVAVTGTEVRGPWHMLRRPKLEVVVGKAFSVGGPTERPGKRAVIAATDAIMEQIAALLPESRRGAYAAAESSVPLTLASEQGARQAG